MRQDSDDEIDDVTMVLDEVDLLQVLQDGGDEQKLIHNGLIVDVAQGIRRCVQLIGFVDEIDIVEI